MSTNNDESDDMTRIRLNGRKKMDSPFEKWVKRLGVFGIVLLFLYGVGLINRADAKTSALEQDQAYDASGITYIAPGSDTAPQIVFPDQPQQFTEEEVTGIRELLTYLPLLRELDGRISALELRVTVVEGTVVTLEAADKLLFDLVAGMLPVIENNSDGVGENLSELGGNERFTNDGLKLLKEQLDAWTNPAPIYPMEPEQ